MLEPNKNNKKTKGSNKNYNKNKKYKHIIIVNVIAMSVIINIERPLINEIKKKDEEIIFTYKDFCNKKWEKYKLPEIKNIIKKLKLRVTGRKNVLITRINYHFKIYKTALTIQRIFRGHIVRFFYKLRIPFYNNYSLCVNETDGFSLEPLSEINKDLFISFKDEKGLLYGFDIQSLITAYNNKQKIVNPYTREELNTEITNTILSFGNIVKLLYPDLLDVSIIQKIEIKNRTNERHRRIINEYDNNEINNVLIRDNNTPRNNNNNNNPNNNTVNNLINKMISIREKTYIRRIEDLFIEIDLLGNYTQSSWFKDLDNRECVRFIRILYDIWNYRSGLTSEIKRRICSLCDPFNGISITNIDVSTIKEKCVFVMENLVYTGIDDEYRRIGIYYLLSALSVVSLTARMNLYWLYETTLY